MDGSKFLITGARGQLGLALKAKYPNAKATDSNELDITNWNAVENYNWEGVTTVLNAAAYTNVDGAESPEGRVAAWSVNASGIANLVRIARQKDLTLVHISSDYVFDGTKDNHKEDEPFSPLSNYGASKAAGDAVLSVWPKHYLLRTTWVIGEGKNFVRTMLEVGQKGISPKVVHDQVGRLTFASELVRAIDHLLSNKSTFGTYNVTNGGQPASWADITREIFKDADFKLEVSNTTTADYFADKPRAAKRPLKSTLDLAKIESTGFHANDWQKDLNNYINNFTMRRLQ